MADGHKTALELALEAWREVEEERRGVQGDLFDEIAAGQPQVVASGSEPSEAGSEVAEVHRGRGRPLGARNRRTDELSRWYITKNDGRDPLERGIEIAGLPILAKGILEGLAERLGCTRHDAAKFWANILATTLPYTHQRQAAIEVRPPGAPGSGQPILWTLTEEGELIDATHDGDELRAITSSD
jgi:hypothetical protein